MGDIKILVDKCIGCKKCVSTCPFGAIVMEGKTAKILDNCSLCGACVSSCKFEAIDFTRDEVKPVDLSEYEGIWVFAEQKNNRAADVALELLGIASKLAADLETKVSAVIIGENVADNAKTLIAHGADEIYMIEDPALANFNDESYCDIMTQLITEYKPDIVLLGATAYGRSLAPRIASRLDTGLTADCTVLEIDPEEKILIQTRPAFGGNIMASIICPNHRPQMATVRPKVMKAIEPDFSRRGEVIRPQVNIPTNLNTKVLEVVSNLDSGINLADADVIVAAGRGIGEAKNLELINELADALGAAVAASRPLVDAGWIDYSHQVGQTGKTVAPKVYFAFGISGAIQHLAGMSTTDIIIAVNKDKEAPIFKIANYGIVGDVTEVLPAMIKACKERKNRG